jgi:hypothetical protein
MTGRRARFVGSCKSVQGGNSVARTTQGRREAAPLRQGRFGRSSTGQTQATRRFTRGQPEQSGAQKLMQVVRRVLPGGSRKSSAKSGKRSGGPMPGVGGLLSSLGRTKGRNGVRGRKPAMFGLVGAGAAGAAAAVAKRRHGRSSQPAGETGDVSEAQSTSPAATTPAHPADPDPPTAGEAR